MHDARRGRRWVRWLPRGPLTTRAAARALRARLWVLTRGRPRAWSWLLYSSPRKARWTRESKRASVSLKASVIRSCTRCTWTAAQGQEDLEPRLAVEDRSGRRIASSSITLSCRQAAAPCRVPACRSRTVRSAPCLARSRTSSRRCCAPSFRASSHPGQRSRRTIWRRRSSTACRRRWTRTGPRGSTRTTCSTSSARAIRTQASRSACSGTTSRSEIAANAACARSRCGSWRRRRTCATA